MKNKIIVIISFLAGIFIFNSCLKDDTNYWVDAVAGKMYATVANNTLQFKSMEPVPDTVTFSFMVNIATDAPPASAIQLTMMVDTAAVSTYNKITGKTYKPFPNVRILNPDITIAAGTRNAMVNCEVWGADKLNACDNFIAAVSIKSVSDPNIMIASNMKTNLLALPISNPWAGNYFCSGYRLHPSYPGQRLGVDKEETLSTIDCETIIKSGTGDYGSYNCQIQVTRDVIVVNGVDCFKVLVTVIDPATKQIVDGGMYETFTGEASYVPIPLTNDVNYYNPETKVFVLNYFYSPSAPRKIYEVLTRL